MKQKIYIAGIASVMVLVAGAIFKINHWPAAGILLVAGIIMLLVIFLPAALTDHYRSNGNDQYRISYIVTYITCLVVFTAMLFKILHWPYAGILLFIALPFPFVIFLPVWLKVTSRIKNFDINNTIFVLFLLMMQAVFSAFLALNVSKEKIDNTLQLTIQLNSLNANTELLPSTTDNSAVLASANDLLIQIRNCRNLFYNRTGTSREGVNKREIRRTYLDSRNIAGQVLGNDGSSPQAIQLEASLRNFVSELQKIPGFRDMEAEINEIFGLDQDNPGHLNWTERTFIGNYLAWNLVELDAMENSVKVIIKSVLN